jgi:ribonuclease BN (tRNA processing enzyme)/energy-coupling factor transporter ATP-binding protein EcfA2
LPLLPLNPAALAERLLGGGSRVVIYGAMGSGKSTLAAALGRAAAVHGGTAYCIGADPGSPAFGVPGAVSLGVWAGDGWRRLQSEPLCTLDAARFRLPLIQAVARLATAVTGERGTAPAPRQAPLLLDAPGVVRGVAGAEILLGLADAVRASAVLVLRPEDDAGPLDDELAALPCPAYRVPAHPAAHPVPHGERKRRRSHLWHRHLVGARVRRLSLDHLAVVGTAPPRSAGGAWRGRQIALLRRGAALALGEVVALDGTALVVRTPPLPEAPDGLLMRDACRGRDGLLVTAPRAGPGAPPRGPEAARQRTAPTDSSAIRVGPVTASLVNGVFGDPLLSLAIANRRERLLFDLGETTALSPRELHAVSDVFVSHGHIDHIGGFLTLLRGRLSGVSAPCRIYGPPGIREHVTGFVRGVRWDRIGDAGPEFQVAELVEDRLCWTRIQPGRSPQELGSESVPAGRLRQGPGYQVRTTVLDHGIPVLAFALELAPTHHVRPQRLAALGLGPGPWLGELKARLARDELDHAVTLPDGQRRRVDALADELVHVTPGRRLVYATDFADDDANRHALCDLARGADLLICESPFLTADTTQARATRHQTTASCASLALQAGVRCLVPFHFSQRYARRPEAVYRELEAACRGTPLEGRVRRLPVDRPGHG